MEPAARDSQKPGVAPPHAQGITVIYISDSGDMLLIRETAKWRESIGGGLKEIGGKEGLQRISSRNDGQITRS
jgi:hypothetical protein